MHPFCEGGGGLVASRSPPAHFRFARVLSSEAVYNRDWFVQVLSACISDSFFLMNNTPSHAASELILLLYTRIYKDSLKDTYRYIKTFAWIYKDLTAPFKGYLQNCWDPFSDPWYLHDFFICTRDTWQTKRSCRAFNNQTEQPFRK